MLDIDFQTEVIAGLTELRTQMKVLLGNGQPGLIQNLDTRVTVLEKESDQRTGAKKMRADLWAVAVAIVTAVGTFLHIFTHR